MSAPRQSPKIIKKIQDRNQDTALKAYLAARNIVRSWTIDSRICTYTPKYRPEETDDRKLIAQVRVAGLQELFISRLQSGPHPHHVINIRRLNRLENSVDAKDEIGQVDPIVIILQTFGLDDSDQSASDDCSDLGSVFIITL